MALNVDFSRALRTQPELTALVQAIASAPTSEQETDSVEWKSTFDLHGNAGHRFETAKHILGFANRHPDRAAGVFEGCAYLVLGAEPQSVHGVRVEDSADLGAWVSPYTGVDGPRWIANYVEVHQKQVLVFTIEAPRWGDEGHTLRKAYQRWPTGQLFIRREGRTVTPDPSEFRMLQERYKRSANHVNLAVVLDPQSTLRTYEGAHTDRPDWLTQEQARLSLPPPQPQPRGLYTPGFRLPEDHRERGEYLAEVQAYLGRARERWYALLLSGAVRRQLAPVYLSIENTTERNFSSVQVVVTAPEHAFVFFGPDGPFRLLRPPSPPDPWGTYPLPPVRPPSIAATPPFERGEIRRQSEAQFEVIFTPIDVRPHRRHDLPPLFLALPRNLIGDSVTLGWTATATNADDSARGTLELSVESRPEPVTVLVSTAEQAAA